MKIKNSVLRLTQEKISEKKSFLKKEPKGKNKKRWN